MIETREKEIKGSIYSVTQLPARRAIRLKTKLIKTFGPTLAQLFVNTTEGKSDRENKGSIVSAMELLAGSIDPIEYEALIVEILTGVRKDGKELRPEVIDMEFAGDMEALYILLIFVLEVNYANFFTMLGIGSQLQNQMQPTQSPEVTKKTFKKVSQSS